MKRTTYTPDPDAAAAIDRVRDQEHVGPSEAINILIRRGLATRPSDSPPFRQVSAPMGARVPVSNIGAVESLLDEAD